MAKKKSKNNINLKAQFATLVTGAFALVAALQWNSAITEWFKPITSTSEGALVMTIVAVVVTIIAAIASYAVNKFLS